MGPPLQAHPHHLCMLAHKKHFLFLVVKNKTLFHSIALLVRYLACICVSFLQPAKNKHKALTFVGVFLCYTRGSIVTYSVFALIQKDCGDAQLNKINTWASHIFVACVIMETSKNTEYVAESLKKGLFLYGRDYKPTSNKQLSNRK